MIVIEVWRIWCECCGREELIRLDTEVDGNLCSCISCACGASELNGKLHAEKVAEYTRRDKRKVKE